MGRAMDSFSDPIVELRQYTLRPGGREVLIELFDREFVETQEAVGMKVIGQFRDLDDPDRFVWLRGFADMEQRRRALTAFYVEGEAWKAHRDAARSTMVDTTNALLLRPSCRGGGFRSVGPRPARGARALPPGRIVAVIHQLAAPLAVDAGDPLEQHLASTLAQ